MRGFVLTPTYRVRDGIPIVQLYGVLESGEPCLLTDDRTRPHFFVRAADRTATARAAPGLRLAETSLQTFAGEPVLCATVDLPGEVPALRSRLEGAGVGCLEADVRFAYRYLIDRGIRGGFVVRGKADRHARLGMIFHNPTIEPCGWTPTLKALAIDIETDPQAEHIHSIALHTPTFSRVLIVGHHGLPHAEPVHSERELIHRFLAYLDELDPDIITGWNVADFDLAVLARRAHHYGIAFTVGRTDDAFELRKEQSYTRESRAITYGRLVLDALSLVRGAFIRLPDYKLETAARTLLGRGS
jgi:DNA polymerase-2